MNPEIKSFLQSLPSLLEGETTRGITVGGSFSRDEGGHYSDVDIRHYVHNALEDEADASLMRFMDGILISIYTITVEEEAANLRKPEKAIWAIPGLRQARILLDRDGSVAELIERAWKIDWRDLQPDADDYASHELCGLVEEVYKILDGLESGNESKILYAVGGLVYDLARILLVQRGVLIPSENSFFELAQSAAGARSNWTKQFRLAAALDPIPKGRPIYARRGAAALMLYRYSAELLADILHPDEKAVVIRALEVISGAGY